MRRATPLALAFFAACSSPASQEEPALCAEESALTVCPSTTTLEGIDVSIYQSTVNWTQVKASGRVWAIARVSDGTGTLDTQFANNWPGIRNAGMYRGVYQFFRASEDPIAQADLLLTKVSASGGFRDGDLPPVMDIETADGQTTTVVRANMQAWLDHIENAIGRKPIIYTAAFMSATIGNGFTAYPLWVANYGVTCPTMPSAWTSYIAWQYTSTGSVPGVPGANVDHDKWNGTLASLETFTTWSKPDAGSSDGGTKPDAGVTPDAGAADSGVPDAGVADAGEDAGVIETTPDSGTPDAGGGMGNAGYQVPSVPRCR